MSNTLFKVVDAETQTEVNFYDASLNGARHWALDCKRHMKSMTGKDHEVVVSLPDGCTISLETYDSWKLGE